ncbi:MAG: tyrosine-type recombinase/integrase [Candidatus Krumholzibacteria bacterium]|nr:tyrosine-type recombinase/integrase [Candidatus Krumholzibacteria bacterium]MDH4337555.1 tyrosine-type recombinase/integrase [Candidatus Krumholzibacteria bacterium]MDH5269918.1 tyrosine-type recombinase/integrase [Candidatus Krumholzibacteria bacterium]
MQPTRLTEAFIRQLAYEDKPVVVRDTIVKGLMVAVNKHSKSYKVQRDLWVGQRGRRRKTKTVRHTLGTTLELTLDDARTRAMEVITQIKRGVDPNASDVEPGAETWTVERMFEEYMADLRARECADRTISDVRVQMNRYLADWKPIPISDVTRSMAREKHRHISERHGKAVANSSLRLFKAGYNLAMRVVDDPDALPDNPVKAVTFNKVRSSNRVLMPEDLPEWWAKVQALPNPLRRVMHTLGLFSGLRPGTLVSLRREWLHLDEHAISIPRMKSGEPFDLPLSNYMVGLVQQALELGDMLYPGSEWLFPTRNVRGKIIATAVWREKTLPSETGHILRHTYRTIAQRVGLDKIDARMLLDHKVVGIDRVYVHEKALFDRLLASQETMTAAVLELIHEDGRVGDSVSAYDR